MARLRFVGWFVVVLGLVGGRVAWAADAEVETAVEAEEDKRPWYVPGHAAMQLAGSIGFTSAGPGWSFWEEAVEAELMLGWAPRAIAGADFITLTLRGRWNPFRLRYGNWTFRPLSVGGMFSYTFGGDYFLSQPGRYPDGYYWFRTALRPALILGASVGHSARMFELDRVEAYAELVATDFRLVQFFHNPATVKTGIVSLALGARLRF